MSVSFNSDDVDDDDTPQLSAEAMHALAEFYLEMDMSSEANVEENWQLSQFWYSEETASKLSQECTTCIGYEGRIACISCPTLLDHLLKYDCIASGRVKVTLFEYDTRFATKFPEEFVFYDYRKPLEIPEFYHNAFDLIIIDPPFLSDECLIKIAQTVQFLSRFTGTKILVCTGLVMADLVKKLFNAHKCEFRPSHKHNLANEFVCYANYDVAVL
ncbi:unnamed protein product [Thelazia callipaeda]|uniref:Protein-lysine N-methyltransferase TCLT_LOCUS5266 n=1 Tax=Thelazia callipaeda TaxID=103827 RepID=A0A0N5CXX6_THECL|nr:unnamed protein product [Thelazia callipaeda]